MLRTSSHAFLRELDKKLRNSANKQHSVLNAGVYDHAVLGLIFLKNVSGSLAERQAETEKQLHDSESDFHLKPADYGTFAKYDEVIDPCKVSQRRTRGGRGPSHARTNPGPFAGLTVMYIVSGKKLQNLVSERLAAKFHTNAIGLVTDIQQIAGNL